MSLILALDQGTSSSRAVIFDLATSHLLFSSQYPLASTYPEESWVEQDPYDILETQCKALQDVLKQAGPLTKKIAAIGVTNQRETTILWDKGTGKPIYPAIVWQDRRGQSLCQKLKKEGVEPLIQEKTGLLLDPYFSALKISWILENVPGAKEKAKRGDILFGTVNTWLMYHLSEKQKHITDVSNASRTLLCNSQTGTWDKELLKIFDIPEEILPKICPTGEVYDHLKGHKIPLASMIGDQQSALFGQACFTKGMMKVTYGTGCFLLMNIGPSFQASSKGLLTTIGWKIGNKKTIYALEGSTFSCGSALDWMRKNLKPSRSLEKIDEDFMKSPEPSSCCFVPSFNGLGAPHWDPEAKAAFLGITLSTTFDDILKAVYEGISHQASDLIRIFFKEFSKEIQEIRADGGVAKSKFLLQTQANDIQFPIVKAANLEATALGAAHMAAIACDLTDMETLSSLWKQDHMFTPNLSPKEIEILKVKWEKSIEAVKQWHLPHGREKKTKPHKK